MSIRLNLYSIVPSLRRYAGRLVRSSRRSRVRTAGVYLTLPWLVAFWWFGGPSWTTLRIGPLELTIQTP